MEIVEVVLVVRVEGVRVEDVRVEDVRLEEVRVEEVRVEVVISVDAVWFIAVSSCVLAVVEEGG